MGHEFKNTRPLLGREELRQRVKASGAKYVALKSSVAGLAFGTGSVFMALSQGSGELIWWPFIVGKYGLAFMFFLLPACLLQYPITYGICRYSVMTGESIFRGFYRFNKNVTFVLWILLSISFLWFGAYATAGATALTELFPKVLSETKHNVYFWAIVSVVVYFSLVFIGRKVYSIIEKLMMGVAVFTVLSLLIALCQEQVRHQILPVLGACVRPQAWPSNWERMDSLRLVTAIMFAGLGGFWNIFNSYWVLSKKAGLVADNEDEFTFDNGAVPERNDSEANAFWNRFSHSHVSIGIFGNYLTTLCMCILAFAFLAPKGDVPYGWKLAVTQSAFFSGVSWGPKLFLTIAALFLVDTWLTTLDAVSKIHVDMVKVYFPKMFKNLTPRQMYYCLATLLLILTLVTMFLSQPEALLLINGFISAAAMPVLIAAVFYANYVVLKEFVVGRQSVMKVLFCISGLVYLGLFIVYIVYR